MHNNKAILMINNSSYFMTQILSRNLILLSTLPLLTTLASCSKPTVPVFEANKFRTTTGRIEKNYGEINEINKKCEEDKVNISSTLEKMRALLAVSQ